MGRDSVRCARTPKKSVPDFDEFARAVVAVCEHYPKASEPSRKNYAILSDSLTERCSIGLYRQGASRCRAASPPAWALLCRILDVHLINLSEFTAQLDAFPQSLSQCSAYTQAAILKFYFQTSIIFKTNELNWCRATLRGYQSCLTSESVFGNLSSVQRKRLKSLHPMNTVVDRI